MKYPTVHVISFFIIHNYYLEQPLDVRPKASWMNRLIYEGYIRKLCIYTSGQIIDYLDLPGGPSDSCRFNTSSAYIYERTWDLVPDLKGGRQCYLKQLKAN